jgi:CRP-like cAMP-binding protein
MEDLRHLVIADLQLRTPPRIYDDEEVLFRQGSKADRVFFIESGEIALFLSTLDRRRVFVKTAGVGEVLGLASSLQDLDYVATARALAPLRVGVLSSQDLHILCGRHPGLRQALEACVRTAHAATARQPTTRREMALSVVRAGLRFFSKKPATLNQ